MRWVSVAIILVLTVLLTERLGGLLGLREQVFRPVAEVVGVEYEGDTVIIDVRSNALYQTRLAVGFVIVDAQDVVRYRSDQMLIETVEPLAEARSVLSIPSLQIEADQRIVGVVEEHITFTGQFQTPEVNETGAGVTVSQLRLGDGMISGEVALVAPTGQSGTYRYMLALENTQGDLVFESPFFEVELAESIAAHRVFRQEVALEPAQPYRVFVWVQRREASGMFFHSIQYQYPELLTEDTP